MSSMTRRKQSGTAQIQAVPTPQLSLPEILISICGAGDIINARFKVDEKMKRPGPIYLQDERTGKICRVSVTPKIGPLMSSRRKTGNYAFCFFENNDFAIRPNSPVTFVIGEYRKEHIQVVI
jgi:hypothetical protein